MGEKAGERAAAQVIAVGKSAGQHNAVIHVERSQVAVFVPEHHHLLFQIVLQSMLHIAVAVGAGKNNNTEFHFNKII